MCESRCNIYETQNMHLQEIHMERQATSSYIIDNPTSKEKNQQIKRRHFYTRNRQKRGTFKPGTSSLLRDNLEIQEPPLSKRAQEQGTSEIGKESLQVSDGDLKPQENVAKSTVRPASSNSGQGLSHQIFFGGLNQEISKL